jgi:hypothetical protein
VSSGIWRADGTPTRVAAVAPPKSGSMHSVKHFVERRHVRNLYKALKQDQNCVIKSPAQHAHPRENS